ncbi:3-dehydroquinate synthase [Candidatus Micrarchaeota archaeon]|nr:3-dehydroquinate synthase [Candidatus Micrarchaeota archaeon]
MREILLDAPTGKCRILLGDSISNIKNYTRGSSDSETKSPIILTDSNVMKHYSAALADFECIVIGVGEEAKTLKTVESVYEQLLERGIERSSFIVGVGGGIVCDVTGFIASTYLRGIPFGFVPTTLLAQVDASIGGKNGVNFKNYKNIIGTIRQPEFCLCDLDTLKTLPEKELRCGFAEIIKHAAIADSSLFAYLEENHNSAISLHRTVIEKIVNDSIAVKLKIVEKDETESGDRKKLNFGHTIGHAIEKVSSSGSISVSHGEAVSIGMILEAKLSLSRGLLSEKDAQRNVERLRALLMAFGLPVKLTGCSKSALMDAINKDKKRSDDSILLPVLEGIGKSKILPVKLSEIEVLLDDLC